MKERIKELFEKVLSFKFLMFVIVTVLKVHNYIGNMEWLTVTMAVICGHIAMKGVHTVVESKGIDRED